MTIAQRDFASLTDVGVTTRLGDIKRRLLTLGEELEGVAHQRVASFIGDRLKEVEQHSCRIAVIGQIKAGKSSLVNALTRRPDLLPTDVNPSTAVITKLYFGGPAERNNSALFHFFSDEEWDRIMSGGRVGTHTLQRSSALDGPRLQDQLEELRGRAEKRLGPQLGKLLGKHHLFNSVTGSVLERYVSAGEADGEAAEDDEDRHYSDITKIAEIYLEGQPLGYPAVVIDTPGVNDPFMVRDEITHANLGDADIYLVVLTAQQPLSKSDLALLRMLRGLQKDRIIAVVNRVDILDGTSNDYQRLTNFVQDALRQEFPHAAIPVILASARWGNAALNSDDDEMAALLGPAFTAFAEWSGSVSAKETSSWSPDRYWPTPLICQALYKASGVPALIAAIARLIGHSVAEERIMPTASTLGAIAENTATSLRHNLKSMQAKLRDPARAPIALFRDQAGQTLWQLESLLSHIEQTLDRANQEFSKSVTEDLQRLRGYMHFRCEQFAEHQSRRLTESGFSPMLRAGFQDESFELRGQLAEDFYKYITDTAKELVARQRDTEGELRQAAEQTLADMDNVLHFGFQSPNFSPPSLISLSKTTAFDLDDFWNPRNPRGGDRVEEAMAFQALVKSEFGGMVDELLRLAENALLEHIAMALRRLRFLSFSAIYPIAQQLQQFATTLQDKEAASAEAMARAELFGSLFEAGEEELRHCQSLAAAMQTLRRQCIEMLDR